MLWTDSLTASSSSFPVLFLLVEHLVEEGAGEGEGEGDGVGERDGERETGEGGGGGAFSSSSISFSSFISPGGSTLYLGEEYKTVITPFTSEESESYSPKSIFKDSKNMQFPRQFLRIFHLTKRLSFPVVRDKGKLPVVACEELQGKDRHRIRYIPTKCLLQWL